MSSYIIGILFSFILVKFDKKVFLHKIQSAIEKKFRTSYLYEIVFCICTVIMAAAIFIIGYCLNRFFHSFSIVFLKNIDFYNILAVFFLLDFSSTESLAMKCDSSDQFNSVIKSISSSVTFGFIAPLLYIGVFGNFFAIIICLILSSKNENTGIIRSLYRLFAVPPSILAMIIISLLLLVTNRYRSVSFKSMFFTNLFLDPILNIYILIAALMDTFMIIDYKNIYDNRVVKYGSNRNIEQLNLYWLLAKSYIICSFMFIIFVLIKV